MTLLSRLLALELRTQDAFTIRFDVSGLEQYEHGGGGWGEATKTNKQKEKKHSHSKVAVCCSVKQIDVDSNPITLV